MNGVPEEIIRRAEDLVLLSMKGDDLVIACCQMPEGEVEELKEAVRAMQPFSDFTDMVEGKDCKRFSQDRCRQRPQSLIIRDTGHLNNHGLVCVEVFRCCVGADWRTLRF